MVTVTTKEDFEKALKAGEEKILLQGDLAKKVIKMKRMKKAMLIAGVVATIGGGIALAPITGGASIPASGLLVKTGAGTTSVAMTVAELAIIAGVGLALGSIALLKNYTIKIGKEEVLVEKK